MFIKLTRRYKIKQSSGSQRPAEKKFQNGEEKKSSSVGITWSSEARAKIQIQKFKTIREKKKTSLSVGITWPSVLFEAQAKSKIHSFWNTVAAG